ncbi:BapA/Bap/LapF family prefix-like domain-containing protein [Acinetobacter radioresistens]|uniref:BapA/Bap/LapF family prefix-like domain-containing protein n=1 Tax=Acinetobacter radioresistens TaxID=40216 RepID=UPI0009D64D24|nr:BapA prefix-like domain-containing protein [Acinetobacter radioresistens]
MTRFIVIEKSSLQKTDLNVSKLVLNEASIIQTKLNRNDVAEFSQQGNNLVIILKNGEIIVIENFFIKYENGLVSDLVFEEDSCAFLWFDGVSGFKEITGLEELLPAVNSGSGALPWIIGGLVSGGVIAAITDHDNSKSPAPGELTLDIDSRGNISGTTKIVTPNTEITLVVSGLDKNGNLINKVIKVLVKDDGSYEYQLVPEDGIIDGSSIEVIAKVTDKNGNLLDEKSNLDGYAPNNNGGADSPGLNLIEGNITIQVSADGNITGSTTDVPAGTEIVLTLTGQDENGAPLTDTIRVTVGTDGSYTADVPAGFADGSITVDATATDRNGNPLNDDANIALDRVDGTLTVALNDAGRITGSTTDVPAGTEIVLTLTGQDENGAPLTDTVRVTVGTDGSYTADVPAGFADGSITVDATATDRNGNPLNDDANVSLNLIPGSLNIINIDDEGVVTGNTTDVSEGSNVVLTFTDTNGNLILDTNGQPLSVITTVQSGGSFSAILPQGAIGGTETININASAIDRNGTIVQDNEDIVPVVNVISNGDDALTGGSGDDVLMGDRGGVYTNFVAGQNYNVSIVLDLSGSMLWAMNGNQNPAIGQSRLEIAKKGLKAFIEQMAEHDGIINLQIASFSANNGIGNAYNQTFTNVNVNNIEEIFTYIGTGKNDGLRAGGGTNPELGFNKANNWFDAGVIGQNGYENQTYYITDGEPNSSQVTLDNAFAPLAAKSKVFAVGVSSAVSDATVSRYDNTDSNGNKLPGVWNGNSNHGEAKAIADADKLIAYLIGGSENFKPANVGNDTIRGGAGDDILFGDAINTNWLNWSGKDAVLNAKYSGYSTLIDYLKAEVTGGSEPTQEQVYDFMKANYRQFIAADAADPITKGGDDIIYGGSGNDIIIAGAGNDIVEGGAGNDIISTGRGNDTVIFDVLNAADATAGNGMDTWVDFNLGNVTTDSNADIIQFGSDFFDGLLADQSNIAEYIKLEQDGNNVIVSVDRDGIGSNQNWANLVILENHSVSNMTLQDLLDNNQIIIG